MESMDCTDIRALISGLVDDELDASRRHLAERHLAECAECRAAVGEMETLNQVGHAAAQRHLVPESLPDGFAGAVLSRTVYATGSRGGRKAGWLNWLGWMAAAAALFLAVLIWAMDNQPPTATDGPARMVDSGARDVPAGEPQPIVSQRAVHGSRARRARGGGDRARGGTRAPPLPR